MNIIKQHSVNDKQQIEEKLSIKDFQIIGHLAEGSYAQVLQALDLRTNQQVVIKTLLKSMIVRLQKQNEIFIERYILQHYCQQHLGLIKFHGCFQDEDHLFFVLEYCPYGDFDQFISTYHSLNLRPEHLLKCYIKQIVEILIFLHEKGIAHLDLKPSNLVIDSNFNFKLIDFSTCYFYDKSKKPQALLKQKKKLFDEIISPIDAQQFVGTAQFVSPEMLEETKASFKADLWSLGCIVYQVYHNKYPFDDACDRKIFENIITLSYKIDKSLPSETQSLISSLLQLNPDDRLGAQNTRDILNHPYFQEQWLISYQPWNQPIQIADLRILFRERLVKQCSMGQESLCTLSQSISPVKINQEPRETIYFKLTPLKLSEHNNNNIHINDIMRNSCDDRLEKSHHQRHDSTTENQTQFNSDVKQQQQKKQQTIIYNRIIGIYESIYCFPQCCLLEITQDIQITIRPINKRKILYYFDNIIKIKKINDNKYLIGNIIITDLEPGQSTIDIDLQKIQYKYLQQ